MNKDLTEETVNIKHENKNGTIVTEPSENDLDGMPAKALQRLKPAKILKANKELVKQGRGLDPELLKDKQAIKDIEAYAKALGNPNRAIYGLPNQLKFLDIRMGIKIFYPKKFRPGHVISVG